MQERPKLKPSQQPANCCIADSKRMLDRNNQQRATVNAQNRMVSKP
ncbi:hypothetical protein Vi05172_g9231 [Venturia inaequalis]|nr:hypothetical protein Vi05172_g9231 [Venturia inaequalis]